MGSGVSKQKVTVAAHEAVEVKLEDNKFHPKNVTVYARQGLRFIWSGAHNIVQVVPSEGNWYIAPGGFQSGEKHTDGDLSCSLGLPGTYFFTSEGIDSGHVRVRVLPRPAVHVQITDDGFVPQHLEVLRGDSVTWSWSGCKNKHALVASGAKDTKSFPASHKSGSKTLTFEEVSVYRFQSLGIPDVECTITIRPAAVWHAVKLTQRGTLEPPLLDVKQGDVVVWSAEAELEGHRAIQQLRRNHQNKLHPEGGLSSGYNMHTPLASFMYTFNSTGYYCFTSLPDVDVDDRPEALGTVIVHTAHEQFFMHASPQGLSPACVVLDRSQSLLWSWDGQSASQYEGPPQVLVSRVSPASVSIRGQPDTSESLPKPGTITAKQLAAPMLKFDNHGLYTCELHNSVGTETAAVVVCKTPESRMVRVTDKSFTPKVLIANQGDTVWFKWSNTRKRHGISQMCLNGKPLSSGFSSPKPCTSTGAFMHVFDRCGSFYYSSPGHSNRSLGMILVLPASKIHVLAVPHEAHRVMDPIVITAKDTIMWTVPADSDGVHNVSMLEVQADGSAFDGCEGNFDHLTYTARKNQPAQVYFPRPGCFHFLTDADCLMTVMVNEKTAPATPVHIGKSGFYPSKVTVASGSNIRWYWYGEGEYHNVIQVDKSLKHEIAGGLSSGDAEEDSSFLHTFELEQTAHVVSDGFGDKPISCTVTVVDNAPQVATPMCTPCNGGVVEPGTRIYLECATPEAAIHYTVDGRQPTVDPDEKGVFLYDSSAPIVFSEMTPHIRAIAVKEGHLVSHEFISRRFYSADGSATDHTADWLKCTPEVIIRGWPNEPHISWPVPPSESQWLVAGHDILVNGEKHAPDPAMATEDCKDRLSHLPPGAEVHFAVRAYPTLPYLPPLESPTVTLQTPNGSSDPVPASRDVEVPLQSLPQGSNSEMTVEPLVSNISSCDMLGARVEWTLPTSLDAHIAAGHFDLTGFNVLLEERVVSQRLEPSCRKFDLFRAVLPDLEKELPVSVTLYGTNRQTGDELSVPGTPVMVQLPQEASPAPTCSIEKSDAGGAHLVWDVPYGEADPRYPAKYLIHLDDQEPIEVDAQARSFPLQVEPGSSHLVAVTAFSHFASGEEVGPTSEPIGFKHLSPPAAPTLAHQHISMTSDGLDLFWTGVEDGVGVRVVGYKVAVVATRDGQPIPVCLSGDTAGEDPERNEALGALQLSSSGTGEVRHTVPTPRVSITNCQPGAEYTIMAAVITDCDELPYSEGSEVLKVLFTAALPAPTDVQVVADATESKLQWDFPESQEVDSFEVVVQNAAGKSVQLDAPGTARSIVVPHSKDFRPGDRLSAQVLARGSGAALSGPPSEPVSDQVPSVSIPVPELTIVQVDDQGIQLQWSGVEDLGVGLEVLSHQLYVNDEPHGDDLGPSATEFHLPSCEKGQTYRLSVMRLGNFQRLEMQDGALVPAGPATGVSATSTVETVEFGKGPPPTKLSTASVSMRKATILWPDDGASHHIRWWRAPAEIVPTGSLGDSRIATAQMTPAQVASLIDGGVVLGETQLAGDKRKYELIGLEPATNYIVIVDAKSGPTVSRSEPFIVATRGPPAAPTLSVAGVTANSVILSWVPGPTCGIDVVAFELNVVRPEGEETVSVSADKCQHCIEDLADKTTLLVTCVAKVDTDEFSSSPRSNTVECTTCGVDGPVLSIGTRKPRSVLLAWTEPKCFGGLAVSGYKVRWQAEKSGSKTDLKAPQFDSGVLDRNVLCYEITANISGASKSLVDVEVFTEALEDSVCRCEPPPTAVSNTVAVSTAFPPEAPTAMISRVDDDGFLMNWQRSRRHRGCPPITGYRILINNRALSPDCEPSTTHQTITWRRVREEFGGQVPTDPGAVMTAQCVAVTAEPDINGISAPMEFHVPDHNVPVARVKYDPKFDVDKPGDDQVVPGGNFTRRRTADGGLLVSWKQKGEVEPESYSVLWHTNRDPAEKRVIVEAGKQSLRISPIRQSTIYFLTVCATDQKTDTFSSKLGVIVPGPPDAPVLRDTLVKPGEFHVEWEEPQEYGIPIIGYQLYLDRSKIGNRLDASHRVASVPCKASRSYAVGIVALGTDDIDSEMSRPCVIRTPGDAQLYLRPQETKATSITVSWSGFFVADEHQVLRKYVVEWSSVVQPRITTIEVDPRTSECTIQPCSPGHRHFVLVRALGKKDKELMRSEQLVIHTPAPPDAPQLRVTSATAHVIQLEWDMPKEHGTASIDHFLVTAGDTIHAVPHDVRTFTLEDCKPCETYKFTAQSITNSVVGNSPTSEPLEVICPGAKGPEVTRRPSQSVDAIAFAWTAPVLFGAAQLSSYEIRHRKMTEPDDAATVVQVPSTVTSYKLSGLPVGVDHVIVVSAIVDNADVVPSQPFFAQTARKPDAPYIQATLPLASDRVEAEQEIRGLLKERAEKKRFLRSLEKKSHKLKPTADEAAEDAQMVAKQLMNVEVTLAENLRHLRSTHTGKTTIEISWALPEDDGDALVSGYQLYVNKQLRQTLSVKELSSRIELDLSSNLHVVTVCAMTENPVGPSRPSNEIRVDMVGSEPFSYRCALAVHKEGVKWPNTGCCAYLDTFIYEIEEEVEQLPKEKPKLRLGGQLPTMHAFRVDNGDRMRINRPATLLVFWSHWCKTAPKLTEYLHLFAAELDGTLQIISCMGADDRDDANAAVSKHWKNQLPGVVHTFCDPTMSQQLLLSADIKHVPELMLSTSKGALAWRGYYPATSYEDFRQFLMHKVLRVLDEPCETNCSYCIARNQKKIVSRYKPIHPYALPASPAARRRKIAP